MARLFSKDYHEHSASWYFNHAIIVLEAGDLEYWRSVDEQGLYHLRFFPRPEVRHHFCQRLDLVYDPVSQLIVRHECSECGEEELCRHFLSLLRYAYHHLKTDIFDSPAVETCTRDDLRISETGAKLCPAPGWNWRASMIREPIKYVFIMKALLPSICLIWSGWQ